MKKYFSVILSLLTFATIGCGSSSDLNQVSGQQGGVVVRPTPTPSPTVSPTPSPTPSPTIRANLRIVNPSANIDNMSVSIDGTVVDADLDRLESTPYLELDPGTHTVSVSGTDFAESTTVTLAANSYSSTVYVPDTLIFAQTTQDPDELVTIVDDVTPVTGQLNARLFNALTVASTVSFFDDNDTLLLGPVAELTATAYQTFAASVGQSDFFRATVQLNAGSISGDFIDELDTSDSFVDAIIEEVGVSGVNLSIFLTLSGPNNTLYVLVLVDEAGDGSRAIRSEAVRAI